MKKDGCDAVLDGGGFSDDNFQPLPMKKDGCDDRGYFWTGFDIILSTTPHEEGWLRRRLLIE